jgi:transketolase
MRPALWIARQGLGVGPLTPYRPGAIFAAIPRGRPDARPRADPLLVERARPMASSAVSHVDMANAIRALAMDAVEAAKSGHPGMPMGMADAATVLFQRALKFDPGHPEWPDRDRFVLSAGHGSMLLYALLHLTGYRDMTLDEIRRFRQLGSRTAGHPEYGHAAGIETTTGPLGQGLANAVGMALAERLLNARFGDALVDHHTYVLAGDGCLMEGVSQEAITLAGHLGLGRLIVLFDDNAISIDGATSLSTSDDAAKRFEAAGWDVQRVDGHDPAAVAAALARARETPTPSLIACRTIIGYGAPKKAGTAATHGSPLGAEEVAGARAKLGWNHPPFAIPANVQAAWRAAGARGAGDYDSWSRRLAAADAATRREFERVTAGDLPAGFAAAIEQMKMRFAAEKPKLATRQYSGLVLDELAKHLPELVGGSADLTGSNNTKAKGQAVIARGAFGGHYIHYGVREHGMAAAMNGMALHGGIVPYGGTFLVFTDYARPSIRLSALMGVRVVYVMTHDSIGLGEDGPTHQPVEHLAALRAIPNLLVFRPADAVETAECWALALAARDRPSVIALTRQSVPALRIEHTPENLSARGAYVLAEAAGPRRVTLLATGSEVGIAAAARATLAEQGIAAAVVSMPSWELFARQPKDYRDQVLGPGTVRVACEAASGFGWERWLGAEGGFVGMTGFGASAPAEALYRHFGITAEAIVSAVKTRL